MKITRSTVLAAAAVSTLTMSLAACGGDSGGDDGGGDGAADISGDVTMLVPFGAGGGTSLGSTTLYSRSTSRFSSVLTIPDGHWMMTFLTRLVGPTPTSTRGSIVPCML